MARPEWEVEITSEGLFDVGHKGKVISYDRDTLDDAMAVMVRRGAERGGEFTLIEPDGYRTRHRIR